MYLEFLNKEIQALFSAFWQEQRATCEKYGDQSIRGLDATLLKLKMKSEYLFKCKMQPTGHIAKLTRSSTPN